MNLPRSMSILAFHMLSAQFERCFMIASCSALLPSILSRIEEFASTHKFMCRLSKFHFPNFSLSNSQF